MPSPPQRRALLHNLKCIQDCVHRGFRYFCCGSSYGVFSVCLKHVFIEKYAFLMEDLVCADLTDQVLVYFKVADPRHRVFKKVICSMKKN